MTKYDAFKTNYFGDSYQRCSVTTAYELILF